MKFECIKGIASSGNECVVVMQGDIVTFDGSDEGEVCVTGIAGWCESIELIFQPNVFVEHFRIIGIKYSLNN
jgi:hypothetical protein